MGLEAELAAARDLDVAALADSIESIGFECTRCGACCKGREEDHTATVFPDEVRAIQDDAYDWRDVARPMPFGLSEGESGDGEAAGGGDSLEGETFEWALRTDACGDCTFYDDGASGESGACTVYGDRPLICRTYPFSVGAAASDDQDGLGASEPMGGVVEQDGMVRAHECEGLGRDISREDAEELASTLKERTVRELEEAIDVRDSYEPTDADGVVVHDSEGAKRPDGSLAK
jgi:Fe-S-cluster containining protein